MRDLKNGYVEIENGFLGKITLPIEMLNKEQKREYELIKER